MGLRTAEPGAPDLRDLQPTPGRQLKTWTCCKEAKPLQFHCMKPSADGCQHRCQSCKATGNFGFGDVPEARHIHQLQWDAAPIPSQQTEEAKASPPSASLPSQPAPATTQMMHGQSTRQPGPPRQLSKEPEPEEDESTQLPPCCHCQPLGQG
eukprot:jgi/Tetstr1/423673/TSEL_014307.t1